MTTLAICWKAVLATLTCLGCCLGGGLIGGTLGTVAAELTESKKIWVRVLGWALLAAVVLGFLILMYYLLAEEMCS